MKNIREIVYWALDLLHGSPVKKKMNVIGELRKKGYDNADELTAILRYAIDRVPYYKNIKVPVLSDFPVVSKEVMKTAYDSFRSEEYPNDDNLTKVFTSGSSGTPFKAYQTKEKDDFHKAALILKNREIGWNLGDL